MSGPVEDVTACALCGGGTFATYERGMYAIDGVPLDLARCLGCGFVFVTPRPVASRLKELYASSDYYETDYTLGVSGSSYFSRKEELLSRYDLVVSDLERTERKGRIFEVGAAGGFFLEAARRRGWTASGVEISPFAADYARRELGLDVLTGDISEVALAPESQDVVYVDNILEHTVDPVSVLRTVRGILRQGGLLVVIVPTYVSSVYFRLLRNVRHGALGSRIAAGRLGLLLKLRGSEPGLPYHIDEFGTRTLGLAMTRAGLRVERVIRSVPIPDYLENGRVSGLGLAVQKAAFHSADALMQAGLLPGARVEVRARP